MKPDSLLVLIGSAGPAPLVPKPIPWVKDGIAFRAPTGNELKNLPYVQRLLQTALEGTNAGSEKEAHEKGGWIYVNSKGELLHRWAEDGPKGPRRVADGIEYSIALQSPPLMAGYVLIANFHAHPLTRKQLRPQGRWPTGPSLDDNSLAIGYGVPCLVIDAAGTYVSGRTAGRRRLDGNPGYPRDRG